MTEERKKRYEQKAFCNDAKKGKSFLNALSKRREAKARGKESMFPGYLLGTGLGRRQKLVRDSKRENRVSGRRWKKSSAMPHQKRGRTSENQGKKSLASFTKVRRKTCWPRRGESHERKKRGSIRCPRKKKQGKERISPSTRKKNLLASSQRPGNGGGKEEATISKGERKGGCHDRSAEMGASTKRNTLLHQS